MQDGTVIPRTALVVAPRAETYSPLLDSLGVRPVPHPLGEQVGESYTADPSGASDLPGLWLAGNVTDLTAQVISSAAQGVLAAAAVNADLIDMETRNAVEQHRQENQS